MTLAFLDDDEIGVRRCFQLLRELREQLRVQIRVEGLTGIGMDELSMGMSGDFKIAIEEGATIVRVGQALFGPRSFPDSHSSATARWRSIPGANWRDAGAP